MSDMVKNAEFVLQKCGSGTCTNSGKKQQSMGVVTALTVVAAVAAGYYFLSKR
jgi:hypothetical protein